MGISQGRATGALSDANGGILMHARSRFARLGRPTLYAIIASMLLPLLFSATAPQAAASPDKNWATPDNASASSESRFLLDNLETGWTYSETDPNARFSDGGNDEETKTEGDASRKLVYDGVGAVGVNSYMKISKSIDLTGVGKIWFDFKHSGGTTDYGSAQCYVGGEQEWSRTLSSITDWITVQIDVSGLSGPQTIDLGVWDTGLNFGTSAFDVWFDNMRKLDGAAVSSIDDNIATKWQPSPANESGAWINWNLGTIKGVRGSRIYWGANEDYRPTAYHIQTSDDNSSWTTVVTEISAAPASAWKEYSWTQAFARYVKLTVDTHGASGTEIFEMDAEVNYSPTIENITVNNSLVDRKLDYSGSGAELNTTITIRVQDNDGYEEISAVYISIRDNNDSVIVDNVQLTDNTVVDTNTLDFTYLFDCPDSLPDDNLGAFDVLVVVEDNWGAPDNNNWGGDGAGLFTVDDRYSSISFDPASPHVGWVLTVSGTHSRYVGSSSITGSWLIDNYHGQFSLGTSDSYDCSYTISEASFGDNASVMVRSVDGVLDGVSSSSYVVNDNIKFQIWVRFEDNYALAGWIPDENRGIDLLFEWDGGTYPYTLTANPENIIVPEAGASMKIVKLTDNDDYWRYFIPPHSGGNLNFIIVEDISDVELYRFYLQDYTAQYTPPDGQMLVKFWIGTDLAEINGDYWGADWRTTAWLVTGTQYQIWVRGVDAPLRLVGPIDAVNPAEEKTIVVQMVIENVIPIFDYVYWNAWRVDNNIIRVEYRDNLDNTIEAHVAINDENGVMQIEYQPDNEWFITTWISANGAESYEVVLTVQHGVYGNFVMTMPLGSLVGPPGVEGIGNPFDLPGGLTLAALGSVILVFVVGLSFDALRVQMGMLAMALTMIFCWQMGFLPLPGPYGGSFTAVLILMMAVLFALTWRRGK